MESGMDSEKSIKLSRGFSDPSHNSHQIIYEAINAAIEPSQTLKPCDCCSIGRKGELCLCNNMLYKIRPYTFELMSSIQPFFEVIATSQLNFMNI